MKGEQVSGTCPCIAPGGRKASLAEGKRGGGGEKEGETVEILCTFNRVSSSLCKVEGGAV